MSFDPGLWMAVEGAWWRLYARRSGFGQSAIGSAGGLSCWVGAGLPGKNLFLCR